MCTSSTLPRLRKVLSTCTHTTRLLKAPPGRGTRAPSSPRKVPWPGHSSTLYRGRGALSSRDLNPLHIQRERRGVALPEPERGMAAKCSRCAARAPAGAEPLLGVRATGRPCPRVACQGRGRGRGRGGLHPVSLRAFYEGALFCARWARTLRTMRDKHNAHAHTCCRS